MFTKITQVKIRALKAGVSRIAAFDKCLKVIKDNNLNVRTGLAVTFRAILITGVANLEKWHIPSKEEIELLDQQELLNIIEAGCVDELLTALEDTSYYKLSQEMFKVMAVLPQAELMKIDLSNLD